MSKFIVVTGDKVLYDPTFMTRTVVPVPAVMTGTGHADINALKVCVAADINQLSTKVMSTAYIAPPYTVPGTCKLEIQALNADQLQVWCDSKGNVITVGTKFIAVCTGITPATLPPPASTPDPTVGSPMIGTGSFINTQFFVTAG
ncbi:hypothetical protein [Candidatus Pantoea multigeneris]|uniref:hypothetical protein n=1 Tax=Candidatus Pantoea multigeneris TaxID=2608357 RepID=UPI0014249FF5|nr:hypothetical protein [Pantoea multigeneris]